MKHARPDYQARIVDVLPPEQGGIPVDEPVFLIRARDILAPTVVAFWAFMAEQAGVDPAMVAAVKGQVKAIVDWQANHGAFLPDMPK